MYRITVFKNDVEFDNYDSRSKAVPRVVWEGYSEDDPWEKFYYYILEYSDKFVVLTKLQSHSNLDRVLVEYWKGEIYFS
jgi:hypothetical protein